LLLGGHKGHLASFDWKTGKLGTEINVNETVRHVQWLHNETLFAAAQKRMVYIYDQSGAEIHALDRHVDVSRLEFLPYHFLLVSVGNAGFLKYQVCCASFDLNHRILIPSFKFSNKGSNL
jgi:U3 small nucleolar RNA-associated protein 7